MVGVLLGLWLVREAGARGPATSPSREASPPVASRPSSVTEPQVIPLVLQGGSSAFQATGPEPGQTPVAAQPPAPVPGRPLEVIPPPPQPMEPGAAEVSPGRDPSTQPPPGFSRSLEVDSSGQISLHANDLDIRQALELLSRQGRLNILVSPGVSGRVNVNLEGASLDQALDAILHLGNLVAKRQNQIIYVYTKDEYAVVERQNLITRIYKLNYLRSHDVETMIKPLLSDGGRVTSTPQSLEGINTSSVLSTTAGGGGSGSSGGGGAGGGGGGGGGGSGGGGAGGGGGGGLTFTGGNTLSGGDVVVVQDIEQNVLLVDDLIRRLDIKPIQVLIEAVIISVELDRDLQLGVNFGFVDNLGQTLGVIGNGSELSQNAGFVPASVLSTATASTVGTAAMQGGKILGDTAVGFPSNTNGIKFGFIAKNTSGFVRALQTLAQTHVLASPRLLVLNKQRAEIQLGQRLGYFTVTQNLTSTVQQVQFLNTGTLLRLRPFVSNDGMVRMEIHPERSSGTVVDNVPTQSLSELTTNIMIPDGATLVIGGLIENEDDFNQQGLPGLNRIPGLNFLFGFKDKASIKQELIVLLTPHIWDADLSLAPPLAETTRPGTDIRLAAPTKPAREGRRSPTLSASPAAPLQAARTGAPTLMTRIRGLAGNPAEAPKRDEALLTASALVPAPAVPSRRVEPRRNVVQRGENFWTIARLYYGSGRYYKALWAANRGQIEAPDRLQVGMTVMIPAREALDPALIEPPTAPASPPSPWRIVSPSPQRVSELRLPVSRSAGSTEAPRPRTAPEYPIHVVQPHETLRSIAGAALGDARRDREILELNRDTVAESRELVPGQFLLLPPDARPIRTP